MVSTNKNLINRILYNFSIFIILIPLVNFRTKIMLFHNNKKFFILFFYRIHSIIKCNFSKLLIY